MKKKLISIQEYEFPIQIQEEKEGGFSAFCTQWPACFAQGNTIEEVITEITYVASSMIELYREEGFKIPLGIYH